MMTMMTMKQRTKKQKWQERSHDCESQNEQKKMMANKTVNGRVGQKKKATQKTLEMPREKKMKMLELVIKEGEVGVIEDSEKDEDKAG